MIAQPPPFAPIADRDLWEAMQRAFADTHFTLAQHQQIQRILADVQREALMREARAKDDKSLEQKPKE
jgi:hypothetical protein